MQSDVGAITGHAGGVGVHDLTAGSNNVKSAQSAFAAAANAAGQATTSAAAAQNAANQALAAAQQANNIATTTVNTINAILQGCGCVSPTAP